MTLAANRKIEILIVSALVAMVAWDLELLVRIVAF